MATAGIQFGIFNIFTALAALSVFAISYLRLTREMKTQHLYIFADEMASVMRELEEKEYTATSVQAFAPFGMLVLGFVLGFPIFLVGLISAVFAMLLTRRNAKSAEREMMEGVSRIATPIVATIGFLFMSTVIRNIGLVQVVSDLVSPVLSIAPIQIMMLVAFVTAFLTQSYAASVAVILPFLQVVLQTGASPFAAAFAAATGAGLIQYFLTGGPVAALATVIPVIPGSDLKTANAFQRPSILGGVLVAFIMSLFMSF